MKQLGRRGLLGRQLAQAPNWAAAAAVVESAVRGESGTTAAHSRILEWHTVNVAAAGCTGHLMAVVLKRGGWRMAEKEEQSSREHCTVRVLHDAEGGGGGAAAVAVGGRGSS